MRKGGQVTIGFDMPSNHPQITRMLNLSAAEYGLGVTATRPGPTCDGTVRVFDRKTDWELALHREGGRLPTLLLHIAAVSTRATAETSVSPSHDKLGLAYLPHVRAFCIVQDGTTILLSEQRYYESDMYAYAHAFSELFALITQRSPVIGSGLWRRTSEELQLRLERLLDQRDALISALADSLNDLDAALSRIEVLESQAQALQAQAREPGLLSNQVIVGAIAAVIVAVITSAGSIAQPIIADHLKDTGQTAERLVIECEQAPPTPNEPAA
jgi:hypothetical protein